MRTRGSEQFRVPQSGEEGEGTGAEELAAIRCSAFSIRASVTAGAAATEGGGSSGGSCGEAAMSSPVLRMEVSMWKVAFSDWVKRLVSAGEDSSHGSGGW